MRKIFVIAMAVCLALPALAQNYSKTISVCSNNYTISAAVQQDRSINVTITDINDATKEITYSYSGTSISDFATIFQDQFLRIADIVCSSSEKNILLSEGNKLWYQLVSTSPAPKAGLMIISDSVKLRAEVDCAGCFYTLADSCRVQEVHIEINNGYLETIYAIILVRGRPRIYTSFLGIGFSSFENYSRLDSIRLVEIHTRPFPKRRTKDEREHGKVDFNKAYTYINITDLLHYYPELGVDRRDYSPKDTAFTLAGGKVIQLFKEETTRLFEAHIFSDFIGLQENQPNGLIQTEVSKRINISSVQWKIPRLFYGVFKSYGMFQYISPSLTLSKLEQHNKRLFLGDLDSIRFNPGPNDTSKLTRSAHRYATALDLYRHQSFSGGFDLNFFYFSNHSLKYNLYFNLGARLGITSITDSLTTLSNNTITKTGSVDERTINTLQLMPEIRLTFLPEERFNFSVAYQCLFIHPFDGNLHLLSFEKDDPAKFIPKGNSWLNTFELLLAYNVNPNNKLFGRLRFNSEFKNYNNNFAQVQIGYSTYILGH